MTIDSDKIPDDEDTMKMTIEFDSTVSPKTMTIKACNIKQDATTDPTSFYAKTWFEDNSIFKISSSYYLPDAEMYGWPDTSARTYTFTIIGYDENGKDENLKNKALLKLAYPEVAKYPSGTPTDSLFSNDSIGAIYEQKTNADLRVEIETIGGSDFDVFKTTTGLSLTGTSYATLTTSDIEQILDWFETNQLPSLPLSEQEEWKDNIANFRFVKKIVNPAYFEADGFIGTWNESANGTLSSSPEWVKDNSDLLIDEMDNEIISPAEAASLTFSEEYFIVK